MSDAVHALSAEAIDAEIARRRANADGETPQRLACDSFPAPEGALVDGYQVVNGAWCRIDHPGGIDLDALNDTLGLRHPLNREEAARLWRDSIGELTRSNTGCANCVYCGMPDENYLNMVNSPGERRCCDRCDLATAVHPRPIPARMLTAALDRGDAGEH